MQLKTVLTIAYDLIFVFKFKSPVIRFLIFYFKDNVRN